MSKPCEYCGCDLPVGVDKKTRQVRSHHFDICTARPKKEVEESEEQKHFKMGYDAGVLETQLDHAKERNFCPRCGKRLHDALGPVSLHTCCPPSPTGWDNGLSQDYNKELGAWFSEKPNAKEELRARTFDDYGNKIT